MKKEKKVLRLKKEIKGYLLMLLATLLNLVLIQVTDVTLDNVIVYFTYNIVICLLILIITQNKK